MLVHVLIVLIRTQAIMNVRLVMEIVLLAMVLTILNACLVIFHYIYSNQVESVYLVVILINIRMILQFLAKIVNQPAILVQQEEIIIVLAVVVLFS